MNAFDLSPTLAFLEDLAQNNHKAWFDAHRDDYEAEKARFRQFTQALIEGVAVFEPAVAGVEVKQSVFRINRDIRFSKDKRPYKINFACSISPGGRHSIYANYYFHLQPHDQSFVGGGLYMPPSPVLRRIRQEIDYNAKDFLAIVQDRDFQNTFGKLMGERLQTAPKGYDRDHPMIDYLRLKSYTVIRTIPDNQMRSGDVGHQILSYFKQMKAFNQFLSQAVDEPQ